MTPKSPLDKDWKRARKPSQKAVRRDEILAAARRLFALKSYDEVSLNGIAREAGMSKPNVYRYFASREEIFLHLLSEQQERFHHTLCELLRKLPGQEVLKEIAEAWIQAALAHPELMTLLPQLGTSLEKNSSVEQLVVFKKHSFGRMAELAAIHRELYPEISLESWGELLTGAVALLSGLWPLCHGGEAIDQAMLHPDVGLEPWDFSKKMRFTFRNLLLGAAVSHKPESSGS